MIHALHLSRTAFALAVLALPNVAQDAKPAPPPNAPPEESTEPRGLRHKEAGAVEGLTLISPINSHSMFLVDLDGEVVHEWKTDYGLGGVTLFLDNGHILRCVREEKNPRFHGGGIGGRIHEIDWDGKVVWEYELVNDARTLHHDFVVMPNGNLLAIAWEYHSQEEAIAHGRDPAFVGKEGLWTDVLLEIKPKRPVGGDVVWTWRTWDHLVQDRDDAKPGFAEITDEVGCIDINFDCRGPAETAEEREAREKLEKEMRALGYVGGGPPPDAPPNAPGGGPPDSEQNPDWQHTNAIDYLPAQDLIVTSSPHANEIWIIDHSTTTAEAATSKGGRRGHGGEILYRWGNALNYGSGATTDQKLFGQHNVTWQPAPSANALCVMVYNNGGGRADGDYSSIDKLTIPFDPQRGFPREAGKPFGPDKPSWSYDDRPVFFSGFISGAQQLANGNVLVCEGAKGRVFEITAAGHVVWDYLNPLGGEIEPSPIGGKAPPHALFRATRIAKGHPGLAGRL